MKTDPVIAVPLAVFLCCAAAKVLWIDPQWAAERAERQPLKMLESQVEHLRAACSERGSEDTMRSSRLLVSRVGTRAAVEASAPVQLAAAARQAGWQATIRPRDSAGGIAEFEARLTPVGQNRAAWRSLMAFLEALSARQPQFALTRLAICADEKGRYSAEATLRVPYVLPNEETSE